MKNDDTTPSVRSRRPFKWYYLYFLLASFDLLTIGVTLYLSHSILQIYQGSVDHDLQWSERSGEVFSLGELAALVNAPGNDVFESLDTSKERATLIANTAKYQAASRNIRADFQDNLDAPLAAKLLPILDQIDREVATIIDEAREVFHHLDHRKKEEAANRMAVMDQYFSRSLGQVSKLCRAIRNIQNDYFQRETARAARLGQYETIIGGCVVFIVFGATWYGYKLAHQMAKAERQIQKSEEQVRSIMDSSLDCIVSVDHDGKIITFNPAAVRCFGCTRRQAIGRHLAEALLPESVWNTILLEAGQFSSGGKGSLEKLLDRRLENIARRADGTEFPVEMVVTAIPSSNGHIFTFFLRDMSQQKQQDQQLRKLNRDLVDASRKSGMSEVATGVLHNVGNVLNSINVSVDLFRKTLLSGHAEGLQKAVDLLDQHRDQLAEYLTQDEQGMLLLQYLSSLSETLQQENSDALEEVESLIELVDHVKEIVQMQQSFARVSGVKDKFLLCSAIDDAIKINDAGLQRHGVDIFCDYRTESEIIAERHKVIQVMINLISNAKYAVSATDNVDKRIAIRVDKQQGNLTIFVQDNGVGISPEHLAKIFSHGFTTKKDGHGFGLHSSVLAAKEMGGSLVVASDGIGHGATFTLSLPAPASIPEDELCLT